jgi:Rad3-related DNA helicase
MHPEMTEVYGRHEYKCLYYLPDSFQADEIPCLSLDCPHRVDQETGATAGDNVAVCPYYQAKYKAKHSAMVVCTAAFYLFTNLFSKEFNKPAGLVIDEAHQMAKIVRGSLSYEVTDYHLKQAVKVLQRIGAEEEAGQMARFLKTMLAILKNKPWDIPTLLSEAELQRLIKSLRQIDSRKLQEKLAEAIREGYIDPKKERLFLKQLESITFDLHRYIRSFEFSLPGENRAPLNYVTYATSQKGRAEYKLVIKAYYVAPLVQKLMSPLTIAYSATVGDSDIFGFETGIKLPFASLPGLFPAGNTLVALPKDTPNLLAKQRSRHEPAKVLRRIARSCKVNADNDIRSLVVVVSNAERDRFMKLAAEEGVDAISYTNGSTPKEAMVGFKNGKGTTLVGTVANYGEGIDLPGKTAPVIFFLRPGYPNPNDPASQFEVRRFGSRVWQVRNWRVMIEALQVRGRNVRSPTDKGVTIFISQHFRKFLYGSLPVWLKESYQGDLTFDEAQTEALRLLG